MSSMESDLDVQQYVPISQNLPCLFAMIAREYCRLVTQRRVVTDEGECIIEPGHVIEKAELHPAMRMAWEMVTRLEEPGRELYLEEKRDDKFPYVHLPAEVQVLLQLQTLHLLRRYVFLAPNKLVFANMAVFWVAALHTAYHMYSDSAILLGSMGFLCGFNASLGSQTKSLCLGNRTQPRLSCNLRAAQVEFVRRLDFNFTTPCSRLSDELDICFASEFGSPQTGPAPELPHWEDLLEEVQTSLEEGMDDLVVLQVFLEWTRKLTPTSSKGAVYGDMMHANSGVLVAVQDWPLNEPEIYELMYPELDPGLDLRCYETSSPERAPAPQTASASPPSAKDDHGHCAGVSAVSGPVYHPV